MEEKTVTVELIYWYWGLVAQALERLEKTPLAKVPDRLIEQIRAQARQKTTGVPSLLMRKKVGGSKRAVTLFAGEWDIILEALEALAERTTLPGVEEIARKLIQETKTQLQRQLQTSNHVP